MVTRRIAQGEIYWIDLGAPDGAHDSEPAYSRPVVVVQNDWLNATALATTVVVPLTSNLRQSLHKNNVLIPAFASGLRRDSVALTAELLTVNRFRLESLTGALPISLTRDVIRGIVEVIEPV